MTSAEEEARFRVLYLTLGLLSLALVVALLAYAGLEFFLHRSEGVGDSLVHIQNKPFEFPEPEYFPIYAKPVTWLYVGMVLCWFSVLELNRSRLLRYSMFRLSIFRLIAFLVLCISAYEVFYNFSIWSALMAYQATTGNIIPDILVNKSPNPETPWNLVFATKLFTALAAISAYTLWYLHRIEQAIKARRE
ncbi:MAG: hypothetical protein HA494_03125 [Thaumarchaeota archaeon]|jgi:hypothetical protein|nr:hypothetical protein [Nitrososphaerota archaeon]